ncbi:MAG TPA: hypothetical protein VGS23_08110 [Thermoplasmata archaeon]|nr:hypothetical protein [Thermoplasmata archaeon]
MAESIEDLRQLPAGSHCVSFHVGREEAGRRAVAFLSGAPDGQAASYWVPGADLAEEYRGRLTTDDPAHVGCVAILGREQVEAVGGKLRPVAEVRAFIERHPEGVTAAGETITQYWTAGCVPEHLEYEAWFQAQPNPSSRFLCPYDLREIPAAQATSILRELGAHHTHVSLSRSRVPAVRLLQLFAFPSADELPGPLAETLEWATRENLVEISPPPLREVSLTPLGDQMIRSWSEPAD